MVKQVIKLGAAWCAPCKAFSKVLDRIGKDEKYQTIEFKDLDIEDDSEGIEMAEKYAIRSVPTTLVLDEEMNVITKVMGATSESSFKEVLDQAMNESK